MATVCGQCLPKMEKALNLCMYRKRYSECEFLCSPWFRHPLGDLDYTLPPWMRGEALSVWISESNSPEWILTSLSTKKLSPELLSQLSPWQVAIQPLLAGFQWPGIYWLERVLRETHLSSNLSSVTDCCVTFNKSFDLFIPTIPPLKNRSNSFWTGITVLQVFTVNSF